MGKRTRNIQSQPTPMIWVSGEAELQPFFFRGTFEGTLLNADLRDIVVFDSFSEESQQTLSGSLLTAEIHEVVKEETFTEESQQNLTGTLLSAVLTEVVKEEAFTEESQQTLSGSLITSTLTEVVIEIDDTSYDVDRGTLAGSLIQADLV